MNFCYSLEFYVANTEKKSLDTAIKTVLDALKAASKNWSLEQLKQQENSKETKWLMKF